MARLRSTGKRVPNRNPRGLFANSLAEVAINRTRQTAESVQGPHGRRRFPHVNNFQRAPGIPPVAEGSRFDRCELASPQSLLERAFQKWHRERNLRRGNRPALRAW